MKVKCLIIDDEPSSQNILNTFINDIDFLELKGIFNNAIDAIDVLRTQQIDLLFLDINMPKISGLEFYKSLQNPPKVIFTTAYAQYAIDGFEVNAIDYLLKPFSFNRFLKAVNKLNQENITNKDYLIVKANKAIHKAYFTDIQYIEACGDYVKIHLAKNIITTNSTFTKILERLPQNIFIRTHKSFAINTNKVKQVNGNIVLIDDIKVPIGQKYKSDFIAAIT